MKKVIKNKFSLQESENSNVRSFKMRRNTGEIVRGDSLYNTLSTSTENSTCYSNSDTQEIINKLINSNITQLFAKNVSIGVFGMKVIVRWIAPTLFRDNNIKELGINPNDKETIKKCIVDKIKPTYYTIQIYDNNYKLVNSVNSNYYNSDTYLNSIMSGYYIYKDPIIMEKEIKDMTFNFSESPWNIKIVFHTPTIPSNSVLTENFVSFYVRGYELLFKIKQFKNDTDTDINAPNINFIKINGDYNRNDNRLEESAIEFSSNLLTEIKKKLINSTDEISNGIYKIVLQYDNNNNSFVFYNNRSSTVTPSSSDTVNIYSTNGSFDSWAYYSIDIKYASDTYSDKNFRYVFIESFEIPEQKYSL